MESSVAESEIFGFNEIAILYRLHHLSPPFSETLNQSGIPYRVIGGPSSHLDSPLEYLFHYLKALLNSHDDLSLQAILPVTDKRFDFQTITRLIKSGREAGCSLYTLLQYPGIDELLDPGQINSVQKLFSLLHRFQEEGQSITLEQLIKNVYEELDLRKQNRKMSQNEDDISEWLILAEPFLKGPAYKQLPHFLENISLWKEGETYNPQAEAVTLMTVHGAKGLEFPVVFMVGLESGIFPCTEFGEDPSDLEEERRLFYVGMTRAKKRLCLSYSRSRFLFGKNRKTAPTPFISEIPPDVIETIPDLSQSKPHKKPKAKQLSLFS